MLGLADGFSSGLNDYQSLQERRQALRLRDAAEARAAEAHGLQTQEARLRIGAQQRVDDATNRLSTLQTVGARDQGAYDANEADFNAADAAALRGLPLPTYTAPRPEFRKASDGEVLDAMQGVAAARGDMQGMQTVRAAKKDEAWKAALKAGQAEYDALDDDARAAWWKQQSYDDAIPAFGNYVRNGKSRYVEFSPEGRPSVKLSAAEERMLFAAHRAAGEDPERAMAILQNGTATMRALAKDLAAAQQHGAQVNNQGAHFAATDAHNAGVLAETTRHNKAQEGIARARENRENTVHEKLLKGEQLGQQAAGLSQGLMRAQALGPAGQQAHGIYAEHLAGVNAQLSGLGLRPFVPGERDRIHPKDAMDMAIRLQTANPQMTIQGALAVVNGDDPMARVAEAVQRKLSEKGAAAKPAAGRPQVREMTTRPAEDLRPFRAMPPEQLQAYARAGNELAIAVLREHAQDTARAPTPAGIDRGY